MTGSPDPADPDVMRIYDDNPDDAGLVCRVCGVIVSRADGNARVHWDWHEATNGA